MSKNHVLGGFWSKIAKNFATKSSGITIDMVAFCTSATY